jgi:hypothetical protein
MFVHVINNILLKAGFSYTFLNTKEGYKYILLVSKYH